MALLAGELPFTMAMYTLPAILILAHYAGKTALPCHYKLIPIAIGVVLPLQLL
jgi:hypothetical protein